MISGPTISINHGRYFSFLNPEETPVTIEDIALGLSNTCRYAGQVNRFYSVAEHSVLTSYLVPLSLAMEALMHDAAEAFIGDMVKPLKEICPDYQAVEERVERAIFKQFNLPFPIRPEVKYADMQMLCFEKVSVKNNHDKWSWCEGIETPENITIRFLDPNQAFNAFMARYHELATR